MDEKENSCGVCSRKLNPDEGRYNTSFGQLCTDCYDPSLFWEKANETELLAKNFRKT
jgi:hypothetical protein